MPGELYAALKEKQAARKEKRAEKKALRKQSRSTIKDIRKDDTKTPEEKRALAGRQRAFARGGHTGAAAYSAKLVGKAARKAKVAEKIKARKDARAAKKGN
jgi:hypothetical protein